MGKKPKINLTSSSRLFPITMYDPMGSSWTDPYRKLNVKTQDARSGHTVGYVTQVTGSEPIPENKIKMPPLVYFLFYFFRDVALIFNGTFGTLGGPLVYTFHQIWWPMTS